MKQKGLWAAIAAGVLLFAAVMWWPRGDNTGKQSAAQNAADRAVAEAAASNGPYTYEVTASADSPAMITVDVTESTASGTTQHTGEYLPYSDSTTGTDPYISAQITNSDGGEITCTIKDYAGTVVATNTASGFASIVTCQG